MAHILVVDDEEQILSAIRGILEREGYQVQTTLDPTQALQLCEAIQFDVVLADIMYPEHIGLDLLSDLQLRSPDTKVILFTGAPTAETAIRAIREGAFDYLSKPMSHDAVCRSVRRAIASRNQSLERRGLLEEANQQTQAVHRYEQQIRLFIRHFQGIAYRADPEAETPELFTGNVEEICGYPGTAFTSGQVNWIDRVVDEDRDRVREQSRDLYGGEVQETNIEYRIQTREGNIRWMRDIGQYCDSEEGGACRVQGAIYDITDRKRLDEEREGLDRRLMHAQRLEAIGILAGGIAHDFNNLLQIILGNVDLAQDDIPPDSGAVPCLKEATAAGERAMGLVDQILAFGRQSDSRPAPIKLQLIVKETLKLLRSSMPPSIRLRSQIDPECPEILSDPAHLHQIVLNLCTNAHDAMAEHGGVLTLTLEPCVIGADRPAELEELKPGRHVRLRVMDDGTGIDPHIRDKVFLPFFTTKGVGKGTGLGLSTVYGLVQESKGGMTVANRPEGGCVFEVYFPAIQHQRRPSYTSMDSIDSGDSMVEGETLMFVDDEPLVTSMAARWLGRLGYSTHVFTDGKQALRAFEADPDRYDVVITDMAMPGMTGTELASQILAIAPDTPIILSSGALEHLAVSKIHKLGVRELLRKPYNLDTLAMTIRQVLQ